VSHMGSKAGIAVVEEEIPFWREPPFSRTIHAPAARVFVRTSAKTP
jgi:hypothetical protein